MPLVCDCKNVTYAEKTPSTIRKFTNCRERGVPSDSQRSSNRSVVWAAERVGMAQKFQPKLERQLALSKLMLVDLERLDFRVQRGLRNAESRRSPRRARDSSMAFSERCFDQLFLLGSESF